MKNLSQIIKEQNPEFFYPVRKVATNDILSGDAILMSYNDTAIIVSTPEGEKIVNFCSQGYALIENDNLFPNIIDQLVKSFGDNFEVSCTQIANCKFFFDIFMKGTEFSIKGDKNDIIRPVIRIQHSYNGKLTYQLHCGYLREKLNIVLWGGNAHYVNLSHSNGNIDKIVEGTFEGILEFLDTFENAKELFDKLKFQKVLSKEARIEETINNTNFFKIGEYLNELFNINGSKLNDWDIYSTFAESMIGVNKSDGINPSMDEIVKRDKRVFNYLISN